jgi:hypothetical protein
LRRDHNLVETPRGGLSLRLSARHAAGRPVPLERCSDAQTRRQ